MQHPQTIHDLARTASAESLNIPTRCILHKMVRREFSAQTDILKVMKIVDAISIEELKKMADKMFGEMVKADVDIKKGIVVLDMPMHYDGEQELLKNGSKQQDIWGINLHPDDYGTKEFIEYDSMINIRPSQKNPSKDVLDKEVRDRIEKIITETVHE